MGTAMKLSDLSKRTIAQIRKFKYDRIIEKHEGPWDWADVLDLYDPEFLDADGYAVLLPVGRKHHRSIKILRTIPSADGKTLTLFLSDSTHEAEPFFSGRLAVCEKVKEQPFYLATVYHEWFLFDQPD